MGDFEVDLGDTGKLKKKVYVLSDGIGQSAITVLKASLIQFDSADVIISVHTKIDTEERICEIIKKAKEDNAFVVYTIVKHGLSDVIGKKCDENGVIHYDIISPFIHKLKEFMGKEPVEDPSLLRKVDDKYFKRIEAMEFTLNNDDGRSSEKIIEADIVVLGLSRTSKTPTSFFLALMGYKVVNIPIVEGMDLPDDVFKKDPKKVVLLMMEPEVLQKVRKERLKEYNTESSYTRLKDINNEIESVYDLAKKNRRWHRINTTNKSIEETAREIILRIFGHESTLF